jgi:hypothetical protein
MSALPSLEIAFLRQNSLKEDLSFCTMYAIKSVQFIASTQ